MARPLMTQWQARAIADERDVPEARLLEARQVLAGARRRLPGSREALERIEAQMTIRGLAVPAPGQEAA